jgi:hypothetical protein
MEENGGLAEKTEAPAAGTTQSSRYKCGQNRTLCRGALKIL